MLFQIPPEPVGSHDGCRHVGLVPFLSGCSSVPGSRQIKAPRYFQILTGGLTYDARKALLVLQLFATPGT